MGAILEFWGEEEYIKSEAILILFSYIFINFDPKKKWFLIIFAQVLLIHKLRKTHTVIKSKIGTRGLFGELQPPKLSIFKSKSLWILK